MIHLRERVRIQRSICFVDKKMISVETINWAHVLKLTSSDIRSRENGESESGCSIDSSRMPLVVYSLYSESTRWNFASCLVPFYQARLNLRWRMRNFVFIMRMTRTPGSKAWSGQPKARGILWLQVSQCSRPPRMRWRRASIARCGGKKEAKSVTLIPSLMIVKLKGRLYRVDKQETEMILEKYTRYTRT